MRESRGRRAARASGSSWRWRARSPLLLQGDACIAVVTSPATEFAVGAHRDAVTISRGNRHTRPEILRHHAFAVRVSSPCTHQTRLGFDRKNALHTRCVVLDRGKPNGHVALSFVVLAPRDERISALRTRDSGESERGTPRAEGHSEIRAEVGHEIRPKINESSLKHERATFS